MTRFAIYARFSDEELQNARSIDDQVRANAEQIKETAGVVRA